MAAPFIVNNVSKFRLERGLKQEDLALKAGVSRQTISAIEQGHYTPSVLLALKLAKIFNLPVEKIFSIAYEK